MNNKIKNMSKLLISIISMFIAININIVTQSFAANNVVLTPEVATLAKGIIAVVQVLVSGFFTIWITINGIQYFTAAAAQDKVAMAKKVKWTIFYAVLAYLAIFLFSYAAGI